MLLGILLGAILAVALMVIVIVAVACFRTCRQARIDQETHLAEYRLNRIANRAFQAMFDEARRVQGGGL